MLAKDTQDSARYTVIDGEIMKRLAKDNAAIHLTNAIFCACAGRILDPSAHEGSNITS